MTDPVIDVIGQIHTELDRAMSVGGAAVSIGYTTSGIEAERQNFDPVVWQESENFDVTSIDSGGFNSDYSYVSRWRVLVRGKTVLDARALLFNLIVSSNKVTSAGIFDVAWSTGVVLTQASPEIALRGEAIACDVTITVPIYREILPYADINPDQDTVEVATPHTFDLTQEFSND